MVSLLRLTGVFFFLTVSVSFGQRSHGYGFLGVGGLSTRGVNQGLLHAGGGGEARVARWIGAGAEGGYLGPNQRLGSGLGVASLNGYYHPITDRSEKFDPFATAGYSVLFRSTAFSAFNYGLGFNYWLDSSLGVKVEFRDHYRSASGRGLHYWAIRFGVNFR